MVTLVRYTIATLLNEEKSNIFLCLQADCSEFHYLFTTVSGGVTILYILHTPLIQQSKVRPAKQAKYNYQICFSVEL